MGQGYFTVAIYLSTEIKYQKRVVYDIFMMFGEVGGLRDFFILGLNPLFGLFSDQFLMASIVSKLFRINEHQASRGRKKPKYRVIEPAYRLLIAHACSLGRFISDKPGYRRALIKGTNKIDS